MKTNLRKRLGRLERAGDQTVESPVIIWRIVDPDGTMADPVRSQSADGRFIWEREPQESFEDFEKRVIEAASRLPSTQSLIMRPDDRRDR